MKTTQLFDESDKISRALEEVFPVNNDNYKNTKFSKIANNLPRFSKLSSP